MTKQEQEQVKNCSSCQTFLEFGHEISPSECDNCGSPSYVYWSPQEQTQEQVASTEPACEKIQIKAMQKM